MPRENSLTASFWARSSAAPAIITRPFSRIQQEAHAFALVQVAHDLENLFHDLRGQAHGRFVQQDHVGVGHQRAADGGHLLFAARRIAGLARAALLQAREVLVDAFQRGRGIAAAHAAGVGAGQQVLFDGQVGKAMPAFHHLHDAALDEFGRRQPFDALAAVLDMALGDVAALALEQVRDGAQGRGLAAAVRSQQAHDFARPDRQA
ncbi:hypothetical protein G6F31_015942 [Rhizopus arrhizus]|nr:hypothetical protein G6F31_015942 [Rhizopus arrhizus]